MRQLLRTGMRVPRPSPSMVVALIALFVALGGSAYAALRVTSKHVVDNSLRSGDLRNNDVRAHDLRNNDVRGFDIRNRTVRGRDVAINTLGAENIAESSLRMGGFRAARVGPLTLAPGQTRTLVRRGPFAFDARCAGNVAQILIRTSLNDSAFDGEAGETDDDFDAAEGPKRFLEAKGVAGDFVHGGGAAIARDGTEIVGSELYAGVSLVGQSGSCRFGGVLGSAVPRR